MSDLSGSVPAVAPLAAAPAKPAPWRATKRTKYVPSTDGPSSVKSTDSFTSTSSSGSSAAYHGAASTSSMGSKKEFKFNPHARAFKTPKSHGPSSAPSSAKDKPLSPGAPAFEFKEGLVCDTPGSTAGRFELVTPRTEALYNLFNKECPAEFREAVDAIYGIPLFGSLAFIRDDRSGFRKTVFSSAGSGPVSLEAEISAKIKVAVHSAGALDGDSVKLQVNGKDCAPGAKGINILVIRPDTLEAYVGVFDTNTHHSNESPHLARFLKSVNPKEQVVMVGVRYDAVRRLHPVARLALMNLGMEIPEADDVARLEAVVDKLDVERGAELLSMCAAVNAYRCADVLVQKKWPINAQKSHGSRNTPLLDAVFHGSVDVVKVLLDAGADTSLVNKWHETAADIALKLYGFKSLSQMATAAPPALPSSAPVTPAAAPEPAAEASPDIATIPESPSAMSEGSTA